MESIDAKIVEIFADVPKTTPNAILINDGTQEQWLPRSQIEIVKMNGYRQATIHMPVWLARKKGLI
ncbi:MAG: hypothetical protein HN366_24850 [Deltaproteobacteria bacterium]|jgi:hypothetical protein|nr:hypothetical protein [Deltaproteobacteria bacterium]